MNKTTALTAGAALVITGVGLFTGPAFSSDVRVSHTGSPTATSESRTAPPADVSPVPATLTHAAELTKQLGEAKVVPGEYGISPATIMSGAGQEAGPLEFYPIGQNSADGYKASAVLTDATGRATLSVFVRSATKPVECTPENRCVQGTPVPDAAVAARTSQSTVSRADGATVVVTRGTGTDGQVTSLAAQAQLSDGTVVTAVVRAEIDKPTGNESTRDSVPLTEEQMADLVTRPGFHH